MRPGRQDIPASNPRRLYRIGELVRHSHFSRQTIHNYTVMGLIQEAQWTEGGHRLYDNSAFTALHRIMRLKKTRTLSQIRKMLAKEKTPWPRGQRQAAGSPEAVPESGNNQG